MPKQLSSEEIKPIALTIVASVSQLVTGGVINKLAQNRKFFDRNLLESFGDTVKAWLCLTDTAKP